MNIQLNLDNALGVTNAIDKLGLLNAQIADLQAQAETLKDAIKALGAGEHNGAHYRAVVTMTERETLDMKAVREKLSPQWIRHHTNVTPVVTLKLTARKVS